MISIDPTTVFLIYLGLTLLLAIWWFGQPTKRQEAKQRLFEGFQVSDLSDSADMGVTVLPPDQCEKMVGLRSNFLAEIDKARRTGDTMALDSYRTALKAVEDTMSVSQCSMDGTVKGPMFGMAPAPAPAAAAAR